MGLVVVCLGLLLAFRRDWTRYAGEVAFPHAPADTEFYDWSDDWLFVRLPVENWSAQVASKGADHRIYSIRTGMEESGIQILVVRGGPRFIECLCSPRSDYQHSTEGASDLWFHLATSFDHKLIDAGDLLRSEKPVLMTFKAACGNSRLDIHFSFEGSPLRPDLVEYVVKSARPLSR